MGAIAVLLSGNIVATVLVKRDVAQLHNDLEAQRELASSIDSGVAGVKTLIAAQAQSEFVKSDTTVNNCFADNNSATCTITNLSNKPITTCLQGQVKQKRAEGVTLKSLPVCSGRLEPLGTREVSAPWQGGFARDICNSTDRFGNTILDWEACSFTTLPVSPP